VLTGRRQERSKPGDLPESLKQQGSEAHPHICFGMKTSMDREDFNVFSNEKSFQNLLFELG